MIGVDCVGTPSPFHRVFTRWTPSNVGGVSQYTVYRVAGDSLLPGQTWTPVATVAAVPGQDNYEAVDSGQLVNGALYTYFIVATYGDGIQSDPSNLVTIVGVNEPPVAADDAYSVAEDASLNQAEPGVLANDADPDTPSTLTAALVTGPAHGTLTFASTGSFIYTPAANFNGLDSFTYRASDGAVTTNVATVKITVTSVNDSPTISNITDRTIDANTNTGPIAFTVGDDDSTAIVVSGTSSNTALVPAANLVFGGSGINRTLTVTPAASQSGSTTITVRVTDSGGATATDTFVLTVRQAVLYTFVGVQNVPLPSGKTFKAGSAIPMSWLFKQGTTVVNSSLVGHVVTVRGPLPSGPVRTFTNTDPGSSSFRYDAASKTWQFNLQTKDVNGQAYPVGAYDITIVPTLPSYQPSPVLRLNLVK
jgi:VCBS repeat-containing protein